MAGPVRSEEWPSLAGWSAPILLLCWLMSVANMASLEPPAMRHTKLLAHIVEVARAGSIRKAAEHLNLTASAMNRRIQDLEAELGTPLFERRARGVRLTTAGEMFVRYARTQIAEVEQLRSQIEDLRGVRRGPVRLACSQAVAHDFLRRDRKFPGGPAPCDFRPQSDGP